MYKQALEINEALGRKEGIANNYGNLGSIYLDGGNIPKATLFLNQSKELISELKSPSLKTIEQFLSDLES